MYDDIHIYMTIFFYEYCVCEMSAIFIVRRKAHRDSRQSARCHDNYSCGNPTQD